MLCVACIGRLLAIRNAIESLDNRSISTGLVCEANFVADLKQMARRLRGTEDGSAAWPQPKVCRSLVCREATRYKFRNGDAANSVKEFAPASQEMDILIAEDGPNWGQLPERTNDSIGLEKHGGTMVMSNFGNRHIRSSLRSKRCVCDECSAKISHRSCRAYVS